MEVFVFFLFFFVCFFFGGGGGGRERERERKVGAQNSIPSAALPSSNWILEVHHFRDEQILFSI